MKNGTSGHFHPSKNGISLNHDEAVILPELELIWKWAHFLSGLIIYSSHSFLILPISLPNGVKAIAASLKCCLPNGIPMMVMQKINPAITCSSASHIPPNKNQRTFMPVLRQPVEFCLLRTSLPKGHRASDAQPTNPVGRVRRFHSKNELIELTLFVCETFSEPKNKAP